MLTFAVDGQYLNVSIAEKGIVGKIDARDRIPLGGGTDFFLVQDTDWFITFEFFPASSPGENPLVESRELGRYPRKQRTFLSVASSFYVLKDGPWFVTVDRDSKGIARDNTTDTFLGIELTLVNVLRGEYRELIAFRHGAEVQLFDAELNLVSLRRADYLGIDLDHHGP
jgi:hypothetical protein